MLGGSMQSRRPMGACIKPSVCVTPGTRRSRLERHLGNVAMSYFGIGIPALALGLRSWTLRMVGCG